MNFMEKAEGLDYSKSITASGNCESFSSNARVRNIIFSGTFMELYCNKEDSTCHTLTQDESLSVIYFKLKDSLFNNLNYYRSVVAYRYCLGYDILRQLGCIFNLSKNRFSSKNGC